MEQAIYSCPITKYRIEYIINNSKHTALFNTVISDYKNMKAFLALIRSSIDQLIVKNIQYIMQCITFEEWDNYLKDKTSWTIETSNNNQQIHMIICPINDFLENYGVGIGL